jgi:phage shock protein C
MIAGVLAGLAEYFLVDPTIFRLLYVIIVLITGVFPGILAYLIAYFIIPDRPRNLGLLEDTLPSKPNTEKPKPSTSTPTANILTTTIQAENNTTETQENIPAKDLFRVAEEEMNDRPEASTEMPIVPEAGELKKPEWPKLSDIKTAQSEQDAPSFNDLFTESSFSIDDLINTDMDDTEDDTYTEL